MHSGITIVECPRDAFQGLPRPIPTERKVAHLEAIIAAGIREIDFGSFVSPKAVPQMADTQDVLKQLRDEVTELPRLIAIIANERGLDRAIECCDAVPEALGKFAVGYPFSVAETFQKSNTGKTIAESWPLIERLQRRAIAAGIDLIVYISMGFGNPYGEPWSPHLVADTAHRLAGIGVRTISLADTVGLAMPDHVRDVLDATCARTNGVAAVVPEPCPSGPDAMTGAETPAAAAGRDSRHVGCETLNPSMRQGQAGFSHQRATVGAHFHAAPHAWLDNVRAAYDAGCRRFDTSLGGYGGCPFAQDKLVGNIPTEHVCDYFEQQGVATGVDRAALRAALSSARGIFSEFGHD